jgi:ribokinase
MSDIRRLPLGEPVCVLGSVLIDLVLTDVDRLPDWGTESVASGRRRAVAGQAANVAQTLAGLGATPRLIGVVGADEEGKLIRQSLAACGVETQWLSTSRTHATALTIALVREDGERAFVSDFAALSEVDEQYITEFGRDAIATAGTLCIAGLMNLPQLTMRATQRILAAARRDGITTVLDTGWDPDGWPAQRRAEVRGLLSEVDIFIPNDAEARALSGEEDVDRAARLFVADGAGLVVIKCGSRGAVAYAADECWTVDALPVSVHDTVGAGDAFDGGLLAARGDKLGVEEALRFASATAGLYVSRATARFPTAVEVQSACRIPQPISGE